MSVGGVVIGVVAAVVWWLITYLFVRFQRRLNFSHLSGRYSVATKVDGAPSPWHVTMRRCRLASNRFDVKYDYHAGQKASGETTGQITMNDSLPMCGEGAYTQMTGEGLHLSGLWRVTSHREHKMVFADRTYSGTYGEKPQGSVLAAYVWTQEESFPDLLSRCWDKFIRLTRRRAA